MAISMLKIRRPLGRLIFNMGIAIPGKTVFLIETAPRTPLYERFLYRNSNMMEIGFSTTPLYDFISEQKFVYLSRQHSCRVMRKIS